MHSLQTIPHDVFLPKFWFVFTTVSLFSCFRPIRIFIVTFSMQIHHSDRKKQRKIIFQVKVLTDNVK